jgi:hypothetical protein
LHDRTGEDRCCETRISLTVDAAARRTEGAVSVPPADAQIALSQLIVATAATRPVAVMIARGDLAVELGFARLSEIQEEILWLCDAAHVPVIWATQVLDNLVADGSPSRAEATDAAMSQRAECVMLNKGPFLVEGITSRAISCGGWTAIKPRNSPASARSDRGAGLR